jgi:hypothetical protein
VLKIDLSSIEDERTRAIVGLLLNGSGRIPCAPPESPFSIAHRLESMAA